MNFKKIFTLITASALLLTNTSLYSSSAKAEEAAENEPYINNDISVQGTTSLGNMISKEFSSVYDEQLSGTGCNIQSVEVNGKTADVCYSAAVDCSIVVGIYDDSGEILLGTGTDNAYSAENEKEIQIDINEMPKHFLIKAYLVDSIGLNPLCNVYESTLYTEKMQTFLSKTTDDFEAERVLNFDDDKTANFAVFAENVKLIVRKDDVNTLVSADDEKGVYVFENIDENISELKSGDIFSYDCSEETPLIVKIDTIEIDGTTASIQCAQTSLDEVFEHFEIEKDADMSSVSVDDSTLDSGVEYYRKDQTVEKSANDPMTNEFDGNTYYSDENGSSDGSNKEDDDDDDDSGYKHELEVKWDDGVNVSDKNSYVFKLEKTLEKDKAELGADEGKPEKPGVSVSASVKLTGSLDLSTTLSFRMYVGNDADHYCEAKFDIEAALSIALTAKAKVAVPLIRFIWVICPGVTAKITPSIVFKVEGKIELSGKLTMTLGFREYETAKGYKHEDISKNPKFSAGLKAEGEIYVGFSLEPKITVVTDWLANVKLDASAGVKLKAVLEEKIEGELFKEDSDKTEYHDCKMCLEGTTNIELKLSLSGKIFGDNILKITLADKKIPLHDLDFYVSLAHNNEFGFGVCPYWSYKTTLKIKDKDTGEAVSGAKVDIENTIKSKNGTKIENNISRTASADGTTTVWLHAGNVKYTIAKEKYFDEKGSFYTKAVTSYGHKKDGKEEIVRNFYINDKETAEYTVEMEPLLYLLKVTAVDDDGKPVNNLKVKCDCPKVKVKDFYTNSNGECTMNVSEGKWTVSADSDSFEPASAVVDVTGENSSESVTLNLKRLMGRSNITVKNQDGKPVPQANITLSRTDRPGSANITLKTDSYGVCTERLNAGKYKIVIEKSEYTTVTDNFVIEENEPVELSYTMESEEDEPIEENGVFKSIMFGNTHVGAITENGGLYMWGRNNEGQLGNGTTTESIVPVKIMNNVKAISFGGAHSAAITEDGSLYIWGCNSYGQLGNGTTESSSIPVKIMDNVKAITLGNSNSAAITEDGSLYMWGDNSSGQLGNGTTEKSSVPIKIMDNIKDISYYADRIAAITEKGSLYMWGNNSNGQLGNRKTENSSVPIKIMDNVKTVSLGFYNSAAITGNGSLYTWGDNRYLQIGNGTGENCYAPTKIMDNVKDVSFGWDHSAAITVDGSLYTWGYNDYGQLFEYGKSFTPRKIMSNVKAVNLSSNYSGAITEDGSLYMCGYNAYGQLGNGTTENSYEPVKIMDNVKDVRLLGSCSVAMTEDGSIYMWGSNGIGQFGNGTTEDSLVPIRVNLPSSESTKTLSQALSSQAEYFANEQTTHTKEFTGLKPNTVYNFYSMKSREAEEPLNSDNLLYINQYISDSDGCLTVSYTPISDFDEPEEFAVVYKFADCEHNFINGSCAICGYKDSSYTDPEPIVTTFTTTAGTDVNTTLTTVKTTGITDKTNDTQTSITSAVTTDVISVTTTAGTALNTTVTTLKTTGITDKTNDTQTSITSAVTTNVIPVTTTAGTALNTTVTTLKTTGITDNTDNAHTTITSTVTTDVIPVTTTVSVIIGDISGNGKIDLYDAIEIAKSLIGTRKFTEEEQKIADFNGDGKVDLYDAIGIAKYMLKH